MRMKLLRNKGVERQGQQGFTLIEMLVVLSVLVFGMSFVGSGVFQALSSQGKWRDAALATKELRHAGSWFAGDAIKAEGTSLIDGGAAASSVTLNWTDLDSTPHVSVYSIDGTTVWRTFDGLPIAVARRAEDVTFILVGDVLTFDMVVTVGEGETNSASLQTHLRYLAP